jgi:hypothetical protein
MSVSERRKQYPSENGQTKRPKLGLKFGAGQLSPRPLPRLEGAR